MRFTRPTQSPSAAASTYVCPKVTTGRSTSVRISSKPVSGIVAVRNASYPLS